MQVRHPNAVAGESVDVNGESVPVEDGTFEVPDDATNWLQRWADANGWAVDDVVVTDTCDAVKSDGEVCGRDLPCPYHSED